MAWYAQGPKKGTCHNSLHAAFAVQPLFAVTWLYFEIRVIFQFILTSGTPLAPTTNPQLLLTRYGFWHHVWWVPVTTARRVVGSRIEGRPPAVEVSRRETTRGGPPAWGLSVGLTTPHHKK
jgi:hypothetical protein